jgi:RimJ/RimL family protein N-acetyltransferase
MTIELIALDKHWAQEIAAEGSASLAASCSNFDAVAAHLDGAVDAHIALYERTGASAPWIAYLARLQGTREFVGICSFKDNCRGGRVEIAYHTFPQYERRGFGKAMAAQLVDLALRHPDVTEVIAETLPEENSSTHILRGLGFHYASSATDPDEGEVWQWVLTRAQATRRPGASRFVPMMRASALFSMLS